MTGHDPAWDTASPAFCPFANDGVCPAYPPCPSNDKRVCTLDRDEEEG